MALVSGLSAGLALKIASLGAKAWFLLVIVATLPSGEFGRFFLFLTIAVVIARILSLGSMDQLAVFVAGDVRRARECLLGMPALIAVLVVALAAMASLEDAGSLVVVACLVLVQMTGAYVSGATRTIRPIVFEIGVNLPWIVFPFLVLGLKPDSADELLLLMATAHLAATIMMCIVAGMRWNFSLGHIPRVFRLPLETAAEGGGKALSRASQPLQLRSVLVVPSYTGQVITDGQAIVWNIAESVWQLFMVGSNRRFALGLQGNLSRFGMGRVVALQLSLFASTLLICLGIVVVRDSFDLALPAFSVSDIFAAAALTASALLMVECRYLLWRHSRGYLALSFDIGLILIQGVLILSVDGFYLVVPVLTWLYSVCVYYACLQAVGSRVPNCS